MRTAGLALAATGFLLFQILFAVTLGIIDASNPGTGERNDTPTLLFFGVLTASVVFVTGIVLIARRQD